MMCSFPILPGPHSQLTQIPQGVYSHLIQLQESSKDPSINSRSDKGGAEINANSSILRSTSSGSSNSSRGSFLIPKTTSSSQPKKGHRASLYQLAYLNKPEITELILGSLASMVNGAILPLYGLLFSSTVKTFYEPPHKLLEDSKFWSCMTVLLGVASLLATPLRTYFFSVAGCKLIKRIRLMCFEKVVHMEISWFDRNENSSSAVSSRLSTDATAVRNLVGESLAILVQNISTAIVGLIIGFGASWELSLIVLIMLPLIGLNGYLQMRFICGFSADTKVKSFHFDSESCVLCSLASIKCAKPRFAETIRGSNTSC